MRGWDKPRVCLLITDEVMQSISTSKQMPHRGGLGSDWPKQVTDLQMLAEIVTARAPSPASADPLGWKAALGAIKEVYSTVDGVVVIERAGSAMFAAAVLGALIQGSGKPIVVVGVPPVAESWRNVDLISAVQIAVSDLAGVVWLNGGVILDADSIIGPKVPIEADREHVIGRVDFGIRYNKNATKRSPAQFRFQTRFAVKIPIVNWSPGGMEVLAAARAGASGLILAGAQMVPLDRESLARIEKVVGNGLPVVLCFRSGTALPSNMIELSDVSPEIARVWLMIERGSAPSKWRARMLKRRPTT